MAEILCVSNGLAVLDGDCLHAGAAGMRAVLSARDASGQEMARLALLSRGPSPVARIIERRADVSDAELVGLEVGCP
jgi:hypothetical protein